MDNNQNNQNQNNQNNTYGQPYNGQPYNGQPYNGQPYNGQPYNGQPYNGQPYNGQPYNQPYNQPYYGQPPMQQPKKPGKGKSIASMICGIFGTIYGLVSFFIAIGIAAANDVVRGSGYNSVEYNTASDIAAVSSFVAMGIFVLPLSIVAVCLGGSYKKQSGAHNGMSRAGLITGWVGLGFYLIGIIIAAAN